jgi:hypothetical protein
LRELAEEGEGRRFLVEVEFLIFLDRELAEERALNVGRNGSGGSEGKHFFLLLAFLCNFEWVFSFEI